jgi:hypothetical protein
LVARSSSHAVSSPLERASRRVTACSMGGGHRREGLAVEGVAGPRTMASTILPRARPVPAQRGDGEPHRVTLGGRWQVPRRGTCKGVRAGSVCWGRRWGTCGG